MPQAMPPPDHHGADRSFLASQTFAPNDIVLLNGGISDLIVGMAAMRAGALSAADYGPGRQNGRIWRRRSFGW